MARATTEEKERLKQRLLATLVPGDDALDVAAVCLAISAAMSKANQIPEAQFVDTAGIYYRGQTPKVEH